MKPIVIVLIIGIIFAVIVGYTQLSHHDKCQKLQYCTQINHCDDCNIPECKKGITAECLDKCRDCATKIIYCFTGYDIDEFPTHQTPEERAQLRLDIYYELKMCEDKK